ncbi:hypothetical protein NQ314_020871 [Rhamnusium bicolor]|uniref:Mitochondrial 2-oxoglutarate/malate carrier protein n=1 Tax=Rhamnusium bicolor TaxID=1586634 RepID=A0AAV8WJ30_9CUCU|nr:hypothetical protein NQ314_020871 [Rhamnusium bicolor]
MKLLNEVKVIIGGSAGTLASIFVIPFDIMKNRMQMNGAGSTGASYNTFREIIANEGIFAPFKGLSAGILKQALYTTTRLGMYTWLSHKIKSDDGNSPGFATNVVLGMTSELCGAFVSTPAELVLVRMTTDGRLPPNERRNYKHVVNALRRIYREEGSLTLWRGAVPTMGRAMAFNAGQLASYSQAQEMLMKKFDLNKGFLLHLFSSMITELIITTASMPVDTVKTRLQSMKSINGKPEYRGSLDVLLRIKKNEGILAFWKGFIPCYFRLVPYAVLTYLFLEQMDAAYYKHILSKT